MRKVFLGVCICAGMALASCVGNKPANQNDSSGNTKGTDTATIANDSSHTAAAADSAAKKNQSPTNKRTYTVDDTSKKHK